MLFSHLATHIREYPSLADPSFNPYEAAELNKCRLEFGLSDYPGFGTPFPVGSAPLSLPVRVADHFGNLRPESYLMDAATYDAAANLIHRHDFWIKPPFIWIGVISRDNRIVRYWQWPVVVYRNQIVLRDSVRLPRFSGHRTSA
jgi:hypothetical protein